MGRLQADVADPVPYMRKSVYGGEATTQEVDDRIFEDITRTFPVLLFSVVTGEAPPIDAEIKRLCNRLS